MSGPSHRHLLALALPLIASNLTVPLLGLVDTAVAGHLPDPAVLGAVATGGAVASVVLIGLNFLRMGTTGLAAQAAGARDADALRVVLARGVIVALVLAAVLLVLRGPIAVAGVALVAPPEDVAALARPYLRIRLLAAPFLLANFALSGWFLGLGRAGVAVGMAVGTNLVNAVVDLALVLGMGWGVQGLAWAAVAGEIGGTLVALPALVAQLSTDGGQLSTASLWDREGWRRLVSVNSDLLIRTLCLTGALAFFTAQAAQLGAVALAANAVLLQLQALLSYGLDGFAHAAEVLVGQALGRRDAGATRRAVRMALQWSGGVAFGLAAAYALAGPGLVRLLTDLEPVRAVAIGLLPWMILSPVVSVWAYTYDGIFVGGTWTRPMRNSLLVATSAYVVVTLGVRGWGQHALWAAFLGFLALRGIWLALALPARLDASLGPAPQSG